MRAKTMIAVTGIAMVGVFAVAINQALLTDPALGGLSDGGLTKNGNGTLCLNGVNTYVGSTTVTAGALGGIGTIAGNVIINSGAAIAPGNGGVGTLTVSGDLTLNGNLVVDVDTSIAPSNSMVSVVGALSTSGAGAVTVNNLGTNVLVVGQKFYPFNGRILAGSGAMNISGGGPGVTWNNNLATDGSIEVALVAPAPTPVISGFSLTGATVNLSVTNGAAGGAWTLLQSTNLALPVSQWETNATGVFDANGNLSTNLINAATNQQEFYLLKQ